MVVRNEEDVLAANIEYHKSRGVDYFVVTDHLSTDSTTEILLKYQREGILEYFRENDPAYRQAKWVTKMARRAAVEHSADWVINNDADEFWWPEGDASFKEILENVPKEVDYLNIKTGNFIYVGDCKEDFVYLMTSRQIESSKFGQPVTKKVLHRAFSDIQVAFGNHMVTRPSRELVGGSAEITILHFPTRSREQLMLKFINGVESLTKNESVQNQTARHWRKGSERIANGDFDEWFTDFMLANESMKKNPEKIIHDDRLCNYMLDLKREGKTTLPF